MEILDAIGNTSLVRLRKLVPPKYLSTHVYKGR